MESPKMMFLLSNYLVLTMMRVLVGVWVDGWVGGWVGGRGCCPAYLGRQQNLGVWALATPGEL